MTRLFAIVSIVAHMLILSIKPIDVSKSPTSSPKAKISIKSSSQNNKLSKAEAVKKISDELFGEHNSSNPDKMYMLKNVINKIDKLIKEESRSKGHVSSKECKNFYTGIGTTYNPRTGKISFVVVGSPAWVVGVRVGDFFLNIDRDVKNKYKEGEEITMAFIRNGITIYKDIIIGKICEDEDEDIKPKN